MRNTEEILETEYSEKFDELRKNRMVVSFYKYGKISDNYGEKLVSSVENLRTRLDLYIKTGNTEFLVDIANQAMIEFMYPQHPKAHFDSEGHQTRLRGLTINDIKNL